MATSAANTCVTVGEVAEFLGVQSWRVQRLFERGVLQEPPRFENKRMISKDLVPQIVNALTQRGWYPPKQVSLPNW